MPEGVSPGEAALARVLRKLRRANKLSQEALSERSGVSLTTIKQIENPDPAKPRRHRKGTLQDLSLALGKGPGFLDDVFKLRVTGDESEEPAQGIVVEMLRRVDEKLDTILAIQHDIMWRLPSQPGADIRLEVQHRQGNAGPAGQ